MTFTDPSYASALIAQACRKPISEILGTPEPRQAKSEPHERGHVTRKMKRRGRDPLLGAVK